MLTSPLCFNPPGVQEKMGIMNRGVVYGLWDYGNENLDELAFREGDCMTIIRREDEDEVEWWWARAGDAEGYIPRNLLGVSLRAQGHLTPPVQWLLYVHKSLPPLFRIIWNVMNSQVHDFRDVHSTELKQSHF